MIGYSDYIKKLIHITIIYYDLYKITVSNFTPISPFLYIIIDTCTDSIITGNLKDHLSLTLVTRL